MGGINLVTLNADHPSRPVDWRWLIAVLSQRTSTVKYAADNYTTTAINFYRLLQRIDINKEPDRLYDYNKFLYMAWELYSSDTPKRHELEARILSQEEFSAISNKMALPLDSIVFYETIFFNVLDRISSPSYIIHTAIGHLHDNDDIPETDIWKLYGYWCGPVVVDLLVYKRPPAGLFSADEEEQEAASNMLRAQMQLRVYTLLQQVKLRGTEDLEFALNSFVKLQQLAKDSGYVKLKSKTMDQIMEILRGINFSPQDENEINAIDVEVEDLQQFISEEPLPSLPLNME